MNILKRLLNINGSVLVFSLIILSIILVTSLSVVSVAVLERKSSGSTAKSVQSFNVAQSGVEMVIYQLNKNTNLNDPDDDLDDLADSLGWSCMNGKIMGNVAGGNAEILFKDSSNSTLGSCNATLDTIATIRSAGTASGTSRVVEVAVGANTGFAMAQRGKNLPDYNYNSYKLVYGSDVFSVVNNVNSGLPNPNNVADGIQCNEAGWKIISCQMIAGGGVDNDQIIYNDNACVTNDFDDAGGSEFVVMTVVCAKT